MKNTKSKSRTYLYVCLFLWMLIFQLIGFYIGQLTQQNIAGWYHTLMKSPLNPPDIVFPIVWSVLYVLLAVVGWYLWARRAQSGRCAFTFYSIQMLMNWLWTPLFFQWHLIGFGFFWIVGIILFVALTLYQCVVNFKFAAVLLLPYFIWLFYAAYLNYFIWMHN